ncbi:MAG: peptidase family [Acidimicrobiales bacterium]|nr:peptidase family [Acidimicrobiales bacterium]
MVALAEIPAPNHAEEARLARLERRLGDAPGARSRDDAGNLVWQLGEPPFRLALLAHVDTVFPADVRHRVAEDDRRLTGPGIGDNAVAVAVCADVVERLAPELEQSLIVVFTVGEEGLGSLRGARHACATLPIEAAIALEGHGLDDVTVDAVGCVRVTLRVSGPGGHSWADRGRPSATRALVDLLSQVDGRVNIGLLAGGEAVNGIARHAEATVELRSLDEQELERAHDDFLALTVPDGLELVVETVDRRPAGRIDRDHPLLAAVRATRAELGLPDDLQDGSTDANAALAAGIPALSIGCARGGDMHTPAEWIERESIPLGVAQLEGVLRRMLKGAS